MPALMLIYCGIDILSNLDRPGSKKRATREDYCKWSEKYILPNTDDIYCRGIDLFAARCGIVHTYGHNADLIKEGKARKIVYAWGNHTAKDLKKLIERTSYRGNTSFIHINKFAKGFKSGMRKFLDEIKKDPEKSKLVEERAKEFFSNLSIS